MGIDVGWEGWGWGGTAAVGALCSHSGTRVGIDVGWGVGVGRNLSFYLETRTIRPQLMPHNSLRLCESPRSQEAAPHPTPSPVHPPHTHAQRTDGVEKSGGPWELVECGIREGARGVYILKWPSHSPSRQSPSLVCPIPTAPHHPHASAPSPTPIQRNS